MRRIVDLTRRHLRSSLLALFVIGSVVFAACAPAAPQPQQQPAKPAAPAPAAPQKQEPAKEAPAAAKPAAEPAKPAAQPAKPAAPAAAAKEVPIALIGPISGPWARQGELMRLGADMAVDEINQQGGIKALGGAKLTLKIADAGDSTEKAKNAAQRLVAQEKDLVAGVGAWLSSFTLAVTEVTEREKLPWLTLSYADQITDRGFKFVFQDSPISSAQSREALPAILKLAEAATGKKPATLGLIADNTAATVGYFKPMREGGFAQLGLRVLVDETFTPPLSDPTPMVQKVRNTKPDFQMCAVTATPDVKLLLEKFNEFGLSKGRIPLVCTGGQMGTPELLKVVGPDLLDGVMAFGGNWPQKGQEELVERFKKRTNEPWMTQDSISTYGEVWIIKEALEKAASTDREKIAAAIRGLDLTTGPAAASFTGRRVKFDEKGRREGAIMPIYQWQKGVPITVFPADAAVAQPIWPKQ